jgi:hypothetical protein
VAFSADGRTAYVATDQDLVAVDVASGHVLTTLPVTNFPLAPTLAVAPNGHALFMIDPRTSVTEVSTATNTVTDVLRLAVCGPGVFSPDGRYLYLPVVRGVVTVNTVTGAASSPVPGGGCASGLLLADSAGAPYATGQARGRTTVTKFAVSGASLSPVWSTVVDQQADGVVLALSANGSTLFAGRASHESITPVSTATGKAGRVIADGLDNSQLVLGRSGRFFRGEHSSHGRRGDCTAMRLARTVRTGGFRLAGPVARRAGAIPSRSASREVARLAGRCRSARPAAPQAAASRSTAIRPAWSSASNLYSAICVILGPVRSRPFVIRSRRRATRLGVARRGRRP